MSSVEADEIPNRPQLGLQQRVRCLHHVHLPRQTERNEKERNTANNEKNKGTIRVTMCRETKLSRAATKNVPAEELDYVRSLLVHIILVLTRLLPRHSSQRRTANSKTCSSSAPTSFEKNHEKSHPGLNPRSRPTSRPAYLKVESQVGDEKRHARSQHPQGSEQCLLLVAHTPALRSRRRKKSRSRAQKLTNKVPTG